MARCKLTILSMALLALCLLPQISVQAAAPGGGNFGQPNGGGQFGGGGGGGLGGQGGQGNDPQAIQQRIQELTQRAQQQQLDQMKVQLGANDQEWAGISPLVARVRAAQKIALTGIGTPTPSKAASANPGQGGAAPNQFQIAIAPAAEPPNEIAAALQSLRESQDIPGTPVEVLKQKLDILRRAREKANADLLREEQSLRAVLNPRQEAQLMVAGILR